MTVIREKEQTQAWTPLYLTDEGIMTLTGERCPYGQRVLCDLSPGGKQMVENFFGMPHDTPMERSWNNYGSAVASIMLPWSTVHTLSRFILFHKYRFMTAVQKGGIWYGTNEKVRPSSLVEVYNNSNYQGEQTNFNTHAMTGR